MAAPLNGFHLIVGDLARFVRAGAPRSQGRLGLDPGGLIGDRSDDGAHSLVESWGILLNKTISQFIEMTVGNTVVTYCWLRYVAVAGRLRDAGGTTIGWFWIGGNVHRQ